MPARRQTAPTLIIEVLDAGALYASPKRAERVSVVAVKLRPCQQLLLAWFVNYLRRSRRSKREHRTLTEHKAIYRDLRNYLAGQHLGSTRDEALLHIALKALLCNSYIQSGKAAGNTLDERYAFAWERVRSEFSDLFERDEPFDLAGNHLPEVDRLIGGLALHSGTYDPFGDLYETFMGDSVKGQAGQFFTPQNAVNLLIDLVAPRVGERVLDPACGAGGFLSAVVLRRLAAGMDPVEAAKDVIGIDKDAYLGKLAKARLGVLTSAESDVYCADSLAWIGSRIPEREAFGKVDVILTNPPFGAKIVAASKQIQGTFELGYQWRMDKKSSEWSRTEKLQANPSPQVLFIERCLDLLRPGGRLGIVVPESLISSRGHRYVVEYLSTRADVKAVIGMPENLFKTSGSGGTHTKTCLIVAVKHGDSGSAAVPAIFMAEAKWCGNDSRGRQVFADELPTIGKRWHTHAQPNQPADHLGYMVRTNDLVDGILAPRYYNPDVAIELKALERTHELVSVGDLVRAGVLEIATGHEVGKQAYGTGKIPFVRTSDISNWEIKLDPKQGVSEDIYNAIQNKQDVREGDILMVRDGTYLIGTCAFVTKYDTRIVYQSHLLKIRVLDRDTIDPYLLLAALSSAPVKRQILSKRFTQDIIDSLGNRLAEVVLPLPRDSNRRVQVASTVRKAISDRIEARELSRQAVLDLVGYDDTDAL